MYLRYSVWYNEDATVYDKNYGVVLYTGNKKKYDELALYEYDRRVAMHWYMSGMVRNGIGQHNTRRFTYAVCTLPYRHLISYSRLSKYFLSMSFVIANGITEQSCANRGLMVD